MRVLDKEKKIGGREFTCRQYLDKKRIIINLIACACACITEPATPSLRQAKSSTYQPYGPIIELFRTPTKRMDPRLSSSSANVRYIGITRICCLFFSDASRQPSPHAMTRDALLRRERVVPGSTYYNLDLSEQYCQDAVNLFRTECSL